jgi:predicted TPR repeat methyltransferase
MVANFRTVDRPPREVPVSELSSSGRQFDLVIACDVFCYMGNISCVFQPVTLLACGYFCFKSCWKRGVNTSSCQLRTVLYYRTNKPTW